MYLYLSDLDSCREPMHDVSLIFDLSDINPSTLSQPSIEQIRAAGICQFERTHKINKTIRKQGKICIVHEPSIRDCIFKRYQQSMPITPDYKVAIPLPLQNIQAEPHSRPPEPVAYVR